MSWYHIQAAADTGPAELSIMGDIGESWFGEESITARSITAELKPLSGRPLTVRLNSYGGSVADGLAIYNALRRHAQSAPVTTTVEGVAMSIASLIAMAGDRREMAENALLMVHAPWGQTSGNAKNMRDMAAVLDKYAEAMTSAYTRSALTFEEVKALLTDGEDHFYSAAEAEAHGFITHITGESTAPVAARYRQNRFTQAAAPANPQQESPMTTEKKPDAAGTPTADPINVSQIAEAAAKKERERIAARAIEIRAAFKPFLDRPEIAALQDTCLDDVGLEVDAVRAQLLKKLGEPGEPISGNPRIEAGPDAADKRRAAASSALMARAGVLSADESAKVRQGNPYAYSKLFDLATECAGRLGMATAGKDPHAIVKAAITQSTSDFPVILEDTMHKTLLAAYNAAADTWSQFCSVGSVSDFRDWKRIYTGSIASLDTVGELAEFTNKAIPDGKAESISVTTKGNIVTLSRQAVINDDLGYFLRVTQMLGRAAARSIERDAYALLAANPTMDDGYALFSTNHANYDSTGNAIGIASLLDARIAMKSQMDLSGNDYIGDIEPALLLCPIAKGQLARETVLSVFDPETSNKLQRRNDAYNIVSTIIDTPRLSGNGWYVFADPQQHPVVEVAFLNGNRTPYLETETGFAVDGIRYKVRLDYGVGAVGYQGAYHNVGA
jgi:ATP-dependent protease ClpP protease subunit